MPEFFPSKWPPDTTEREFAVNRASEEEAGVSLRSIKGEEFIEASDEWMWVRRAQRGDREAFDRLVCSHDRHVLRLALCVFGNRERAREVYLQTFLKAARSIRRFRFNSSFRSWIRRIAMEVSVAELKKEEDSSIPPCLWTRESGRCAEPERASTRDRVSLD